MVGAGTDPSLIWTFLKLRRSCKHASMTITSDSDSVGDLTVSLKMVTARQADQAPRRRGRQSSRQERGPGSQAPPPAPPAPPATPAPAATAPVTARRVRNRGPGALLRDERRRLGRIEPGILAHKIEGEGGPALPPPAHRERVGKPALPHPAPRPSPRPIIILDARKRRCSPALIPPPPPSSRHTGRGKAHLPSPPWPLPSPGYPWREPYTSMIPLPLSFSWHRGKG